MMERFIGGMLLALMVPGELRSPKGRARRASISVCERESLKLMILSKMEPSRTYRKISVFRMLGEELSSTTRTSSDTTSE
jgi:hypothetical protein